MNNSNPIKHTTLASLFKVKKKIEQKLAGDYDPNLDSELKQIAEESRATFLIIQKDNVVMYGMKGGAE